MSTDAEILAAVRAASAPFPRPEHFTDYTHCSECREHDETLRSRDPDTLSHDDIGGGSWDPICFVTDDAWRYELPALARLALDPPHPHWGWFGPQLFFHLRYDGRRNRRWLASSPEQRRTVAALLAHLIESRGALITQYTCDHEALDAYDIWSDEGD